MMNRIFASCLFLALGLTADLPDRRAAAAETPTPMGEVSFAKHVQPIFRQHCQGCHQPAKNEGDYVLTDPKSMLLSGESEESPIVAGKPEASYLLALITPGKDGKAEMPQDQKPLSAAEIKLVADWIRQGAKIDVRDEVERRIDADHPPVYELPPIITALDFSPDGKLLAVSGYHEVLLHKVDGSGADGSGLVARLIGLSERIESVAFSPDGKRLAVAGGSPGRMGEIQIWNVEKRALELAVNPPNVFDTVYGASWSPDGKIVAIGCGDNTVRAIDSTTGKQVLFQGAHNDWVLDTAFSVKGDHLITVSRDRSMKLIEVKTERFVDNITSITPGALKGGLAAVDRHPTKEEVVIGGADGIPKTYKIFRTKARKIGDDFNKIRFFEAMPGRVYSVEFNREGNLVVAGSSNHTTGEVRVYDNNSGKLISKTQEIGPIYAVTFSPDSKVVAAAGASGKVTLLDAATGKPIRSFMPVEVQKEAGDGKVAAGS
ncbi:MAG: hypothetical protein MI757_16310 [Pirellulales bacterium]|nr:hypothetical protein [Pirellulales bacterium]